MDFSLTNTRFQIIHIQQFKFMRILISFVTSYTAPKLNVSDVFFMHSFFQNSIYFGWYKYSPKPFYLLLGFGSGYLMVSMGNISFSDKIIRCLHSSFPCQVCLSYAGKLIVLIDFGWKKK